MCGVGGGEALTRLMEEDNVGHGNAIAVFIKTRMVVRGGVEALTRLMEEDDVGTAMQLPCL